MFKKPKAPVYVHMYVSKEGLLRLLTDVYNQDSSGEVSVRAGGTGRIALISVWLTKAQHDSLVKGDIGARYR